MCSERTDQCLSVFLRSPLNSMISLGCKEHSDSNPIRICNRLDRGFILFWTNEEIFNAWEIPSNIKSLLSDIFNEKKWRIDFDNYVQIRSTLGSSIHRDTEYSNSGEKVDARFWGVKVEDCYRYGCVSAWRNSIELVDPEMQHADEFYMVPFRSLVEQYHATWAYILFDIRTYHLTGYTIEGVHRIGWNVYSSV